MSFEQAEGAYPCPQHGIGPHSVSSEASHPPRLQYSVIVAGLGVAAHVPCILMIPRQFVTTPMLSIALQQLQDFVTPDQFKFHQKHCIDRINSSISCTESMKRMGWKNQSRSLPEKKRFDD